MKKRTARPEELKNGQLKSLEAHKWHKVPHAEKATWGGEGRPHTLCNMQTHTDDQGHHEQDALN